MKLKPALPWKSQDVGHASARDTCSEKLLMENGTRPRQRSVLQPTKLNGVRDLKSILTSDMEMQTLEFAQLVFSSCFGPVFPHYAPFPIFWNKNLYLVPLYAGSM